MKPLTWCFFGERTSKKDDIDVEYYSWSSAPWHWKGLDKPKQKKYCLSEEAQ